MSGISTWISNPDVWLAALFGAALLLSVSLAQASAFRSEAETVLPFLGETTLPVLDDSVVIAAPYGYCIDRLGTLTGRRMAFVLMASCRAVTGDSRAASPEIHGLLTASIDGRGDAFPTLRELSSYFTSPGGRAALSRSGNAEAMELGAIFSRDDVLYLQARERGGDPAMGGQSWRAVFELNGRMVTASLRELSGFPIADEDGFQTVTRLVERIRAASPEAGDVTRDRSAER